SMIIDGEEDEIQKIFQSKLNMDDIRLVAGKIYELVSSRGISIAPIQNLLNEYINEDKIRKSNMDFGIVTINLTDMKPIEILLKDIPYGELHGYLLASSYLPIFKFEKIKGKMYLDGGFYNNLPFNILQDIGYKDLIIVRTHAKGLTKRIDRDALNTIIISPSEDLGRSYTYEADMARKNIQLGYYDGLKVLRGLKGKRYYIKPANNKNFSLEFLLSLDNKQIKKIIELVHGPSLEGQRALMEYIIPKLGSSMGLEDNFIYEDFLIDLLERKEEYAQVPRFQIYSIEELIDIIKTKGPRNKIKIKEKDTLEKIIDKVDFAPLFNKEDIILEVADIIFYGKDIEG